MFFEDEIPDGEQIETKSDQDGGPTIDQYDLAADNGKDTIKQPDNITTEMMFECGDECEALVPPTDPAGSGEQLLATDGKGNGLQNGLQMFFESDDEDDDDDKEDKKKKDDDKEECDCGECEECKKKAAKEFFFD